MFNKYPSTGLRERGVDRRKGMTPPKTSAAVPLTISIDASLQKRARLLAAAKDVSLSKLISSLLESAAQTELPGLLADALKEGAS